MGACSSKKPKDPPENVSLSSIPEAFYFNRSTSKLMHLIGKKVSKIPLRYKFKLSPESAIGYISMKKLLIVGGSLNSLLLQSVVHIDLVENSVLVYPDLPIGCKEGQLHEIGEWIYYVGAQQQIQGSLEPAPIMRFSRKQKIWEIIQEQESAEDRFRFTSLVNFGSCVMENKIIIVGGQRMSKIGSLKSNKKIFALSVQSGFTLNEVGKMPVKVLRPIIAAGDKHGIIVGGIHPKTSEYNNACYYVSVKDQVFIVRSIEALTFPLTENYPPVYTREYALFLSFPKVAVRFKDKIGWAILEIRGQKASENRKQSFRDSKKITGEVGREEIKANGGKPVNTHVLQLPIVNPVPVSEKIEEPQSEEEIHQDPMPESRAVQRGGIEKNSRSSSSSSSSSDSDLNDGKEVENKEEDRKEKKEDFKEEEEDRTEIKKPQSHHSENSLSRDLEILLPEEEFTPNRPVKIESYKESPSALALAPEKSTEEGKSERNPADPIGLQLPSKISTPKIPNSIDIEEAKENADSSNRAISVDDELQISSNGKISYDGSAVTQASKDKETIKISLSVDTKVGHNDHSSDRRNSREENFTNKYSPQISTKDNVPHSATTPILQGKLSDDTESSKSTSKTPQITIEFLHKEKNSNNTGKFNPEFPRKKSSISSSSSSSLSSSSSSSTQNKAKQPPEILKESPEIVKQSSEIIKPSSNPSRASHESKETHNIVDYLRLGERDSKSSGSSRISSKKNSAEIHIDHIPIHSPHKSEADTNKLRLHDPQTLEFFTAQLSPIAGPKRINLERIELESKEDKGNPNRPIGKLSDSSSSDSESKKKLIKINDSKLIDRGDSAGTIGNIVLNSRLKTPLISSKLTVEKSPITLSLRKQSIDSSENEEHFRKIEPQVHAFTTDVNAIEIHRKHHVLNVTGPSFEKQKLEDVQSSSSDSSSESDESDRKRKQSSSGSALDMKDGTMIFYSESQGKKFLELISSILKLDSLLILPLSLDIESMEIYLKQTVPVTEYLVARDLYGVLNNVHEACEKKELRSNEKLDIIVGSGIVGEHSIISNEEFVSAIIRSFKYTILKKS